MEGAALTLLARDRGRLEETAKTLTGPVQCLSCDIRDRNAVDDAFANAAARLGALDETELYSEAKNLQAPAELVRWVAENGRLPVVTFTAGGIATPADAALCMQLGADGVFVGSGIFKSDNPEQRAKAIVEATTHYADADVLARVSQGLGDAMSGLSTATLAPEELLETRGW